MAKILLWAVGFVLLLEVYSVLGQDYKLVCYYTNWAHKRRDCKFLPEDINPRLCTHLIFAFAVIGNNHQIVAQEKEDEDLYISFNSLKKRNPNLKTLLSIGGWNFGTEKFTAMASSKETRLIFIKSVIDFLRQKDFDGLDLHWEYPAFNRSPYQDKQHFTLLVQETVEEFKKESSESNKPRLLLSAAVASGIRNIQAGYEIEKISEALDFIGVMTYEFHGPWDLKTGPNSPLYRSSTDYNDNKYFNVEFATNYWKQNGAPAEKLLVGFPTYGRTFTLCSADSKPGAAACGPAPPGNCTKAAGIWAYYEICDFLKGANKEWMEEQEVPYAYKDDEWVTYDNLKSYEKKPQQLHYQPLHQKIHQLLRLLRCAPIWNSAVTKIMMAICACRIEGADVSPLQSFCPLASLFRRTHSGCVPLICYNPSHIPPSHHPLLVAASSLSA
ncbi:acidic mammalian chitinase-like isoform X5 [Rhincodon typus]|uniref:acidic mammalian chitinase-like isoform X5 n=1 Tax=Rhincodon typus TaxID=259920 RepID=UPI00202E7E07|nr:acidic mammalian chitinase-like isoform X5 [Rhincodon typus]